MMVTRIALAGVWAAVYLGAAREADAQSTGRVQPIVLTASPICCQSPADTASEPVCLPAGDRTYLLPQDQDPITLTPSASVLLPLPSRQEWRGYESNATTVVGYSEPVTAWPTAQSVRVLRPIPIAPTAPAVPAGYTVGRGLIGQPKLYKPGQPVRNFLRYISL